MYFNYRRFILSFDKEVGQFRLTHQPDNACLIFSVDGTVTSVTERMIPDIRVVTAEYGDNRKLTVSIGVHGIRLSPQGVSVHGQFVLGEPYALTTAESESGKNSVRAASGPAIASDTDALYDRTTDLLLSFSGISLSFDWDSNRYTFVSDGVSAFTWQERYCQTRYDLSTPPRQKKHGYQTPPVGWMTWYAVKFDASEETVLRNAKWQAENLLPYGADTVWVDWEWYHNNTQGIMTDPDVDTFRPHKGRYPHGMKPVADAIRKLGLKPAIWIGATHEVNINEDMKAHPELILAKDRTWCGEWWIDPTAPYTLTDYIPKIFRQLLDWGYEAFKWDCLPATLSMYDRHHDGFYDKSVSTEDALHNVIRKARETVGEDRYMMSCSGATLRDMTTAPDCFDGARIGNDIFHWDDFVNAGLDRTYDCYRYHNILWYADPDNIVIREEFNTMAQVRSRLVYSSLTGLPQTLGDDLPNLDCDRVELLKKALPAIDTHPMQLCGGKRVTDYGLINLAVARRWGNSNTVGVINTKTEPITVTLDLQKDLFLDGGHYLVTDVWNHVLLTVTDGRLTLPLAAGDAALLTIQKRSDKPQILATSRHLTAGAYDILDIRTDGDLIHGKSRTVAGVPYTVTAFKGGKLVEKTYLPTAAELEWTI